MTTTDRSPLVLGIDASTTACKAVVWDLRGEPAAEGRAALPLRRPRPLWHEQPAEAWWEALVAAVRAAVGDDPAIAARIAALCIAPQRETFVPVDDAGAPLRPAIVWMDERCRALLPRIEREYGGARIHRETGKPLSGNLSLGKILWLREQEPEVFARTARYLDVAAFLNHRLTGAYRTGWGCAGPTGLFDLEHGSWDVPLLSYLGVRVGQMPEAFPPGALVGRITADAADACALPVGLPVVAGIGDGQAGGLGAGVVRRGQAYLNLGTAVISGVFSGHMLTDPAFRTMGGGVPGTYSLETVILGGTYTVTWFLETLAAREAGETIEHALARFDAGLDGTPPGAAGLLAVPYWNSAMSPYWDADASGIVAGWRGTHTLHHLYRAILEGIAFEQRLNTEGVEAALGQAIEGYVAMGGGARSDRWCQIVTDVTGKPLRRAATMEAAALGAGILAAAGAGLFGEVRDAAAAMARVDPQIFEPDSRRHAFYSRQYREVYRQLFPALQSHLQCLANLTFDGGEL